MEGAYQAFFNRPSDLAGEYFWVRNLLAGDTVDGLIAGFLT